MIAIFDFILLATGLYVVSLSILFLLCLPKLRKNLYDYCCRGKREANQDDDMSAEQKGNIEIAKQKAAERNESECSICLEAKLKKGVVLSCSHEFCAACIINFINSRQDRKPECPTCRGAITFMFI